MNRAYLLLGGNIGDKEQNLQKAGDLISQRAGPVLEESSIFVTKAWGKEDQPDFYNKAISIETALPATALLTVLLNIESELGRTRTGDKWQERIIDIDILLYNQEIIDLPELKIPHPYLQDRKFVLAPLFQIAPELVHPVLKKSVEELLNECKDPLEVTEKP
ncbi:MAG TPA: 2-amino-4-hydroxy-6-hydroxymethyldihydropteridine diphosphokinase [Bacteroidia bacterium]|jgi:2-amino-4-hydroxy-6-hydroxymethyldihydropteridine diphosphokinase